MDKILFISGDGVSNQKHNWNLFYTYFDGLNNKDQNHFYITKNYFISKAIKSIVKECDILNFSFDLRHPRFILKLEMLEMPGSTIIRNYIVKIINYVIQQIIYMKIKKRSYDLVVFSDNLFFLNSFLLKKIKKTSSSKMILLSNISPKHLLPQSQKNCIPYYDKIFISDTGHEIEWKDLGAQNVIRLPLSAGSPKTFQKVISKSENSKIYDVTFVGRLDRLHYHRINTLNFLISQGVDLNIWTWDESKGYLKEFPLVESRIIGSAYGKEMVKVLAQSKIVLNIHILTQPCGGNLRLFEIPSAKSFQIADKCPSDWFLDGNEIVLYKNNDDLLNKINYYLNNEQERINITNNGYNRVLKEHRYEYRVKKLLKFVQD